MLGFCLGIPGVLLDWAIARKKKMMECTAEGIWLDIIGWAFGYACRYVLTATGVWAPGASVWCLIGGSFGGALLGLAGITIGLAYAAPVRGRRSVIGISGISGISGDVGLISRVYRGT